MNDPDGRVIRFYLVDAPGKRGIWEASDIQVLKTLKRRPGSKIIGLSYPTRAEAEAAGDKEENRTG